jgi:hypothetical protein
MPAMEKHPQQGPPVHAQYRDRMVRRRTDTEGCLGGKRTYSTRACTSSFGVPGQITRLNQLDPTIRPAPSLATSQTTTHHRRQQNPPRVVVGPPKA